MDDPAKSSTTAAARDLEVLNSKLNSVEIPPELKEDIQNQIARLERMFSQGFYSEEFEKIGHYLDWIIKVPWTKRVERPIDLTAIRASMDKSHYGMDMVKDRIIEYMSVLKLRSSKNLGVARAPIICLVGLVGTGKTTFAYALSDALGRPIARIPFGGMGDPLDLRGQSRMHPEAEPGKVIKALRFAQSRNPVILLDEIELNKY